MTNEQRFKKAVELIQTHEEIHKEPGWDRKIEIAILDIFGDGDTGKGRDALIALARERIEKIARNRK